MRSKVTVVLLFLNVVLFAYIYYYEQPKLPADSASTNVFGPEVVSIDSITRVSRNGQRIRLERNKDPRPGDAWKVMEPFEWPANPDAVEKMLNGLKLLKHQISFTVDDLLKNGQGQTLADFGLDQPAITLTFTSAGQTYTTKIGDAAEIGDRLYLLTPDGKRIHVVNRSLADSIALPLSDLRSDSIFTIPIFEVRSLNIQSATPSGVKVRLRRDSGAGWSFESPITARADKSHVETTVTTLNLLKTQSFLEPREIDLDRAGLSSPSLQITLEGNARHETLLLGNVVPPAPAVANPAASPPEGITAIPTTEYYAKIEDKPVIFTVAVPTLLIDALRLAQEKLRDLRVLDFVPASVTSLTIAAPGQPELTLQRLEAGTGDEGWQAVTRIAGQAPLTTAADPAVITELLQKLQQLTVEKFQSDEPSASDLENFGFNRPERVITLNLNTGGGPQQTDAHSLTLQIGVAPDQPGIAYARTTDAHFVYQVLPDILSAAPAVSRNYRLRLLSSLPETARIVGLKLTDLAANKVLYAKELTEADKNWGPTLLAETAERRKALGVLLVQIRTLRARQFVTETFSPDHADIAQTSRPWQYKLESTVAFPSSSGPAQNSTATLYLTDRIAGSTMLAGTTEFGGVTFIVTQDLLDAVFALTYAEKNDPGERPAIPPVDSAAKPAPAVLNPPSAPAPAPATPTPAAPAPVKPTNEPAPKK